MEKLIPLINKLQEIFYRTKVPFSVEMPQIVVVGGQSSGKSSVLENIVGRDFLPRGTNIVTRRPTIIQLINTPTAAQDWIEFAHKKDEKYFDFLKAREEIELDTERKCGHNKEISAEPIIVKVYSRTVVNLTLVDLPGMTKIPQGGQPDNIEKQINELCYNYANKKTAIIMAVTAANQDLANSDALKLARRVDQTGERTIGVLTKIDLMDKGTNCLDVIQGRVYPLRLGYIGVVCRSQKDITTGKNIKEALKAEHQFFSTNSSYAPIASRMGTPYLCRQLNMIIVKHIKKCLPVIRSKITSMLYQKEKELKSLKVCSDDNETE